MTLVLNVFMYVLIDMLLACIVMLLKNHNTLRKRNIIIDAVGAYKLHHIDNGDFDAANLVEFEDIEVYEKTLWRLWDWGYKRILPKEKFELIKPYIGGWSGEESNNS